MVSGLHLAVPPTLLPPQVWATHLVSRPGRSCHPQRTMEPGGQVQITWTWMTLTSHSRILASHLNSLPLILALTDAPGHCRYPLRARGGQTP